MARTRFHALPDTPEHWTKRQIRGRIRQLRAQVAGMEREIVALEGHLEDRKASPLDDP